MAYFTQNQVVLPGTEVSKTCFGFVFLGRSFASGGFVTIWVGMFPDEGE